MRVTYRTNAGWKIKRVDKCDIIRAKSSHVATRKSRTGNLILSPFYFTRIAFVRKAQFYPNGNQRYLLTIICYTGFFRNR